MIRKLWMAFAIAGLCAAQDQVPVTMTVTAEAAHGKEVPDIPGSDVLVFQGKQRVPVTTWTAYRGDQAGLELFILIDDGSASIIGSQLTEIKDFINAQPPTSLIGVGYMHNGSAGVRQNPTADHAKAVAALRLPVGAIAGGASPYLSLSDLVKKWPSCCVRREVLMITSGIDPLGGLGPINPYLDSAIADAQKAGVIVYSIYTPAAGHEGHSYYRIDWGQNHIAQLSDETGGEAYMLGFGPVVSFTPYLNDIAAHLTHQYAATFSLAPGKKPALVPVRFTTEAPNAEIVAPAKVYVNDAKSRQKPSF